MTPLACYPCTKYFVAAYAIVALIYTGYLFSLWRRSRRVAARLSAQGRNDGGGSS